MTGGIYIIQRKDSDECYIGSAVSIAGRWRDHRSALSRGKHRSRRLQRVWNKHGEASLEFVILEPVADKALLIEREQVWLDRFSPAYNTATVAGSTLGVKTGPPSAEHRAKLSVASKGRKQTPESITARVAALRGKKQRPEVIAARVAAQTGRKLGPQTPEARAAMSHAQKGRKRGPLTPEHRAKALAASKAYWAANAGRQHSAEARARMSVAQKARPPRSAETRERLSVAAKAYWARTKEAA